MIKIENFEVLGWEHAIRGMRNPMNSWAKSEGNYRHVLCKRCDDCWSFKNETWEDCDECETGKLVDAANNAGISFMIGPNDHTLMEKLVKGGPVHAKFRRMITVYVDITAPLYWWKEFDTYKVGTVANSCSTMHKIHEKEFTMEDFSCERLTEGSINLLKDIIGELNKSRRFYNRYDELADHDFMNGPITCKKDLWWQMIQLLPSSYNQKRTVMLNYEVLANIYEWRKNHKLDEWVEFCKWIETLPYSEIITEQREPEHNPLAHPERYVSDAISMIGDMTEAQRVEVMKYLKVKTPEECPYWDYKEHKSLGTCNGCEVEDHGIIINGDRYCNIISPTKEEK